jgi:hypothetical protein
MRLSANKDSPFFSQRAVRSAQITIDGVPIHGVVECDTDEGWADVIETRDDGHIVASSEDPDAAGLIRYTGKIGVTFKENAA